MLDLGNIKTTDWYEVTIQGQKIRLEVKATTSGDFDRARNKARQYKFIEGKREEVIDPETMHIENTKLLYGMVKSWEGVTSGENPAPCNPQTVKDFFAKFGGLTIRTEEKEVKTKDKNGEIDIEYKPVKISLVEDIQTFSTNLINKLNEETENLEIT